MPTIAKLPAASSLTPTDVIPIDQGSGTNGVTLATLFATQQPAIMAPTGTLLGRISTGPGTPETVSLGTGLVISSGTLSLGGSLDGLLSGETVDQLQAASPVSDSDAFALDQGGSSLVKQTMAALWSYIDGKLPLAAHRVVELTTNTVLDATAHNAALIICSSPLTLSANFANMGSGFSCVVLNLSSGGITMGSGITVGSGNNSLAAGMSAHILAFTYSAGNVVYWDGQQGSGTSGSTTSGGSSTTSATSGGSSGTVTSGGSSTTSTATLSFVTAPSGSYAVSQANVGVNATLTPGDAATGVQFGLSASSTTPPTTWTTGSLVNTQSNGATFWGSYLTMPAGAGTYYCWAETTNGNASAVSGGFTVS